MNPTELDAEDADVPQMAVQALNDAYQRAIRSGRPVVVVAEGKLVRIDSSGVTELETLPARRKVAVRTKRVSS